MSIESFKNKRVLISSYQPYILEAAKKFTNELGWEPVVWLVADENKELVSSTYPEVTQYDFFDAVKGILPDSVRMSDLILPSPDELEKLAKYEYNFIYMLERNDSNNSAFEYKERLSFYYHILGLWKYLIKQHRVDLIWFEEEPHQAADYGLYLVAKLMGIPTVMATRTISELGILPYFDFEDGFLELNKHYNSVVQSYQEENKKIHISERIESYFEKMNADYQTILKEHLWDQVDEYNKLASSKKISIPSISEVGKKVATLWDVGSRFILNTPIRSDQYKVGHSMMTSHYSYREYVLNKVKAIRKKKEIKNTYNELAIHSMDELPNNKKLIYVALQYQPEKSTCPLAGRFVDQRHLIKWLVSELDDSWHVVVKEHPSQFISSYTRFGECFRDSRYYHELNELPNVSLMGLSLDSFKIMASCELVASAGGTVCWEAIARGIPALSFAISWFKPCHGVFYVQASADLEKAIKAVNEGFKPDSYLVKAYAQLIKNYDFYAAIGGKASLEYKNVDVESNAQAHFDAIKHLIS